MQNDEKNNVNNRPSLLGFILPLGHLTNDEKTWKRAAETFSQTSYYLYNWTEFSTQSHVYNNNMIATRGFKAPIILGLETIYPHPNLPVH